MHCSEFETNYINNFAETALDSESFINKDFILNQGWETAIISGRLYRNKTVVNRLTELLASENFETIYALNLDSFDKTHHPGSEAYFCLNAPITAGKIDELARLTTVYNFLMVPNPVKFLIQFHNEDLIIAAGTRDALSRLFGKGYRDDSNNFLWSVEGISDSSPMKEFYKSILEHYLI